MLRIEIADASCSASYDQQALRAWAAGERDGNVLRVGGTPDAAAWWITLVVGSANVSIDSNLTETELVDLIDSFGPLDLDAQPVFRTVPPGM